MTIASITTFGFITGSTVSRAVTLGYGAGSAPPVPTTGSDNFLPYSHADIKRYRAKLKRDREAVEAAYAEKLEAANGVRLEIDRILHPPADDFVPAPVKIATPPVQLPNLPKLTEKQRRRIDDLQRQIGVLMAEAHILEEQAREKARQARIARDEDDMRIISALLNAHTRETLH